MTAVPLRERVAAIIHHSGWEVPSDYALTPDTCFVCENALRIADAVIAVIPDPADVLDEAAHQMHAELWGTEDAEDWLRARAQTYREGADRG